MERDNTLPAALPLPFEVLPPQTLEELSIPMAIPYVTAGFPSPADDYLEDQTNLQQLLIRNPSATYLVRVRGNSMEDANLHDDDILVVDRSVKASEGHILIVSVDGEFTVKRLVKQRDKLYLQPANKHYSELELCHEMDFQVWGVVIWTLHKVVRGK